MIFNTKTMFEMISSISTMLAAFAALFTVLQMQSQRKAGLRPKIGILPKVVKYKLTSEGVDKLVNENDIGELPIFFEIVNFGQGPAEFIEINITYSYSLLVSIIEDATHNTYIIKYDNDEFFFTTFTNWKKICSSK